MVRLLRGVPRPTRDGALLRMETPAVPRSAEPFRRESDHWDEYEAAVDEASVGGIGSRVVEDYLGIAAIAPTHPSWEVVRTAPVPDEERHRIYRRAWEPTVARFRDELLGGGRNRIVRWDAGEKNEGDVFGAPFSVYPLPPGSCAALVCDYLKLYTYTNQGRFHGRFRDRGFNVISIPFSSGKRGQQETFEVFLSRPKWLADGTRRMVRIHLGRPLMQQVLAEAMSFETVARAVAEQTRGKVRGEGAVTLLFLEGDGTRFVVDPPPEAARAFDEMARQEGM